MVVIENLREPLAIQHAVHVFGLGLRRAEEVAVVIVADVLLVELRQSVQRALLGHGVAHVPVGRQVVAVGIRVHEQNDAVVQNPHRLFVGAADEVVDHLAELLRAEHFGRMQTAVDPHDRFAFLRQRARLRVGEALGVRELFGDLFVSRELLLILGRGHNRHVLRAALGGLADVLQHHPVRFLRQLLPVGRDLLVIGEEVVVAEVMAELFFGRRDAAGGRGRRRPSGRCLRRHRDATRLGQRRH